MNTILEALREYLGNPDFYVKFGSSTNYTWNYGAMLEYAMKDNIECLRQFDCYHKEEEHE